MAKERACISISRPTKVALDLIKHLGQSYDGLIQELVTLWKKEHGEETDPAPSAERKKG